jgi:hypothetical protein
MPDPCKIGDLKRVIPGDDVAHGYLDLDFLFGGFLHLAAWADVGFETAGLFDYSATDKNGRT